MRNSFSDALIVSSILIKFVTIPFSDSADMVFSTPFLDLLIATLCYSLLRPGKPRPGLLSLLRVVALDTYTKHVGHERRKRKFGANTVLEPWYACAVTLLWEFRPAAAFRKSGALTYVKPERDLKYHLLDSARAT